jgi:hypothetical protein
MVELAVDLFSDEMVELAVDVVPTKWLNYPLMVFRRNG